MVLKRLKWSYFDAYLWQTMWNHTKNQWKSSNFQIQFFYRWTSGALCWKHNKKNIETRQTKTPVSQIFQIICRHSSLLMNSTEAVWGCSTLFIEYCWMYNHVGVSPDSWLTLSYILHNSLDKFRLVWIAASYKSEHANSFKAAYEQWGLLITAHITLKSPSSCCWQLLPYLSGFTIWHNIWGP